MAKRLIIVVPCYNEEEVVPAAAETLCGVLTELSELGLVDGSSSRVCFVDDGSRDNTWDRIEDQAARRNQVGGIRLSRNFGQQNALLAGLFEWEADIFITVDADLQDDVSCIREMVELHLDGCEIVYGVRRDRSSDSRFKRLSAQAFYRIMEVLGAEVVYNHADFRLMGRRAVEHLKEFREVNLFLRGLVPLVGFRSGRVTYDRSPRIAGHTKYPFSKMFAFAWEAITSFSIVPLRIITYLGFVIFFISILLSVWALGVKLLTDSAVPGWASTVLPIYLIGGIQLLATGIVGEYIGKIYLETKSRPRFIVDKRVE